MSLPALTLWQPYASLPFFGHKPWETRTRPYPKGYEGQRIVIHAAAAFAPRGTVGDRLNYLCLRVFGEGYQQTLPRGKALGTIRLTGCYRAEEVRSVLNADEIAAGDFSDGRWAWRWTDPVLFDAPVPCKGWQGWGRFDIDAHLVRDLV